MLLHRCSRIAIKLGMIAALSSAVLVATSDLAYAQQQQTNDAEKLFVEGSSLMEAGKYADAIPKLEEAQRLDPGIGTQFNLATCYEKIGKLGTAWRNYNEVVGLARASGKKQREQAARAKLDELKPRLMVLAIKSEEPGDLVLKVDGMTIKEAEWGSIPVDPGPHKLEATAAMKRPWSQTIDAPAEGKTTNVVIPKLSVVKGETKVVTVDRSSSKRTIGFIAGGVGVAGAIAAGVTGVMLLGARSTAEERCAPKCIDANGNFDQEGADAINRGKTLLPINAVAWGVAIVGLGVGGFLIFTSGGSSTTNNNNKPDAAKTVVSPWLGMGLGSGGIGATTRF